MSAGDTDSATGELDRAEGMSHAADTELLQTLALMQRGRYQQATAYSAHSAGAHLDAPQALAMHAWLLALGEQREHAGVQVTAALQRRPDDLALLALQTQLRALRPGSEWVGAEPDSVAARFIQPGPVSIGAIVPNNARVVATGVLLDGSHTVLVPLQALQAATSIWVRSSLGAARVATLTRRIDAVGSGAGLALLTLNQPLTLPPQHAGLLRASADAFAGSPGHVVGMLASTEAKAAWPAMNTGFIGRSAASGVQALGIDTAQSAPGAPVFDRAGRWIGVVGAPFAEASGNARRGKTLVTLSQLASALGNTLLAVPVAGNSANLTPTDTYERALPLVLQVMVLRE